MTWKTAFTTDDPEKAYQMMRRLAGETAHTRADMREVQTMADPPRTVNRYAVVIPEGQRLPDWFWDEIADA